MVRSRLGPYVNSIKLYYLVINLKDQSRLFVIISICPLCKFDATFSTLMNFEIQTNTWPGNRMLRPALKKLNLASLWIQDDVALEPFFAIATSSRCTRARIILPTRRHVRCWGSLQLTVHHSRRDVSARVAGHPTGPWGHSCYGADIVSDQR